MKSLFKNVRIIDGICVGFEFSAKPSFFPHHQREYSSVGFNLKDFDNMEYKGFLNYVIEEERSKEKEFDLVVEKIIPRENDRSLVSLNQRLLEEGDKIYCHANQIRQKDKALTGKFRGYWTNIGSELKIEKGDFIVGSVIQVSPLHRFVNVIPIEVVSQEEFEKNEHKISRT